MLTILGALLGLGIHIGVIWLDSTIIEKPIYLDLEESFWQSAFSFPFLPMLILEIFLSIATILLWIQMKAALKQAHEMDLKKAEQEITIKTFQETMTLLAQHISTNNNKILQKIEFRKSRGQQTSESIELASRNIAHVLSILSEISFVAPYVTNGQKIDLQKELETRIQKLTQN